MRSPVLVHEIACSCSWEEERLKKEMAVEKKQHKSG
jgi:hypothetical protein